MFQDLLKREDVAKFISEIKTNERYYKKKIGAGNYPFAVSNEITLYAFYEALYKYKVVVDDLYLFDEYLEQVIKLYKKIDNLDGILIGINKLIAKMVFIKLGYKIENKVTKIEVVKYIYDKYIINGYYLHGFNSSYLEEMKKTGFSVNRYQDNYEDFVKLNKIFSKYNVINIIDKDFEKKNIYFTDGLIKGCYYSDFSPNFFYKFLLTNEYFGKIYKEASLLKDDYSLLIRHLKRFMCDFFFSDEDKKFVLELVKREWDLLHRNNKITLMVVKRDKFNNNDISLSNLLKDIDDYDLLIDRILTNKYNNISWIGDIAACEIEFIELDKFYEVDEVNSKEFIDIEDDYKVKEEMIVRDFLDVYGKASVFMILGALFISLGVIVMIIMIVRGI